MAGMSGEPVQAVVASKGLDRAWARSPWTCFMCRGHLRWFAAIAFDPMGECASSDHGRAGWTPYRAPLPTGISQFPHAPARLLIFRNVGVPSIMSSSGLRIDGKMPRRDGNQTRTDDGSSHGYTRHDNVPGSWTGFIYIAVSCCMHHNEGQREDRDLWIDMESVLWTINRHSFTMSCGRSTRKPCRRRITTRYGAGAIMDEAMSRRPVERKLPAAVRLTTRQCQQTTPPWVE
jgi:hypothetical protein